jgi:hypothetical protein
LPFVKTHINFSLEDFEIASDDTPAFGQKCSFTIPKRTTNYLLTNLKLQFSLPAITTSEAGVSGATWINWVNSIGHALIKSVVIKSGNNTLDTHTGAFQIFDADNSSTVNYQTVNIFCPIHVQDADVPYQLYNLFSNGATQTPTITWYGLSFIQDDDTGSPNYEIKILVDSGSGYGFQTIDNDGTTTVFNLDAPATKQEAVYADLGATFTIGQGDRIQIQIQATIAGSHSEECNLNLFGYYELT